MCTGNNWYKRDGRFEFCGCTARVEDIPHMISDYERRGWYFDHTEPLSQKGREDERCITFFR